MDPNLNQVAPLEFTTPNLTPSGELGPVVIIPCFNRKAITLQCLQQLKETGVSTRFRVILVDDGSTDGTSDAVAADFPDVTILRGSGNLFWTGAIEMGMRHAIAAGASCCVWLNDDLSLGENAIDQIVSLAIQQHAIVSGQGIMNLENGTQRNFPALHRGKMDLNREDVDLESIPPIPSDTCRGNLVAIPKQVIEVIGYPDGKNIPHLHGDTDYGLRATAAGFLCLTLCQARFFEKETLRNDNRSWLLGKQPLSRIWSDALSRRGSLYPRMLLVYCVRHWGLHGFVRFINAYSRLVTASILRLTIPRRILLACYSQRSEAFVAYQGRPDETEIP